MEFILRNFHTIHQWLESQESQEFCDFERMPLINPKTCKYSQLSATLAYELNLPLPPFYDLILISSSRCGHNAILDFFEQCGAKRGKDHLPKNLKTIFLSFYDFLVRKENEKDFKIIPFVQYCEFFTHQSPSLVQVRDPFIKLLLVNNRWTKANAISKFTLFSDLGEVLDRIYYLYWGRNPLQKGLNYLCLRESASRLSSAILGLKHLSEVYFVDTDRELYPATAYETMKNLALKYGLKIPKDREFFESLMEENLYGLLPLTLSLNYKDALLYLGKCGDSPKYRNSWDTNTFKVDIIFLPYPLYKKQNKQNWIDITYEILGEKWIYGGTDIRLVCDKVEYELYFDGVLKEAFLLYFVEFKREFTQRNEIEKRKRFSIEEILEYFKTDKEMAYKFKKILEKELICLQEMRPDIVSQWKFYHQFLNLFKETQ